jgi:hypothetical protein
MAGYVALGFTGVKLKVGGAPLAEDVRRVAAVREAALRLAQRSLKEISSPFPTGTVTEQRSGCDFTRAR